MKSKVLFRRSLRFLFNTGFTLSLGFLSFAGMLINFSSLLIASMAFVLAMVYEHQANKEGVDLALKKLFYPNNLKLAITRKHLDELVEEQAKISEKKLLRKKLLEKQTEVTNIKASAEKIDNLKKEIQEIHDKLGQLEDIPDNCTCEDNLFLEDYKKQKKYIQDLKKYLQYLRNLKSSHLKIFEQDIRNDLSAKIDEQEKELKKAKYRLLCQIRFFLANATAKQDKKDFLMQESANALLTAKPGFLTNLKQKTW